MPHMGLKEKLRSRVTFGGWILIGHPASAEVLATAGYDWLTLDLEHAQIDLESATNLFRAMDAAGCHPMVRIPRNDPVWIARFLDAGAQGIIVPMVRSAAEAQAAVEAAKYPPMGRRGFGFARANAYGVNFSQYANTANDELVVVIQVEHIDAVNDIENIVRIPGVDGVIVGPYDLSGSMGILGQLDHPRIAEALLHVRQVCAEHDVLAGFHVVPPEQARVQQAVDEGYRFIAISQDTVLLHHAAKDLLEQTRLVVQ